MTQLHYEVMVHDGLRRNRDQRLPDGSPIVSSPVSSTLIYGEHDGRYLIVASKGGAPEPPAWYVNLRADPSATIQVWGERIPVRARDATP